MSVIFKLKESTLGYISTYILYIERCVLINIIEQIKLTCFQKDVLL